MSDAQQKHANGSVYVAKEKTAENDQLYDTEAHPPPTINDYATYTPTKSSLAQEVFHSHFMEPLEPWR